MRLAKLRGFKIQIFRVSTLPDGSRALVLVSDDNFIPLQQTQILALRLRP